MKWFGNDKNGLTEKDFEKITLGVLLIIVVMAIVLKYLTKEITNMDMVYLSTMLGSLFVVRKTASYFKPERYNQTTQSIDNNGEAEQSNEYNNTTNTNQY